MNQRCLRIVRAPLTGRWWQESESETARLRAHISLGQCVAKPFNSDNSFSAANYFHRTSSSTRKNVGKKGENFDQRNKVARDLVRVRRI